MKDKVDIPREKKAIKQVDEKKKKKKSFILSLEMAGILFTGDGEMQKTMALLLSSGPPVIRQVYDWAKDMPPSCFRRFVIPRYLFLARFEFAGPSDSPAAAGWDGADKAPPHFLLLSSTFFLLFHIAHRVAKLQVRRREEKSAGRAEPPIRISRLPLMCRKKEHFPLFPFFRRTSLDGAGEGRPISDAEWTHQTGHSLLREIRRNRQGSGRLCKQDNN